MTPLDIDLGAPASKSCILLYYWTIEADTPEFSEASYGGKILVRGKIHVGGKIREKFLSKKRSYLFFKGIDQ
jgi:hypothetical protein